MSRITEMLKEPSTYAGLAAVVLSGGDAAPLVADVITNAGPHAANGNWTAVLGVILGAIGMWLREGRR